MSKKPAGNSTNWFSCNHLMRKAKGCNQIHGLIKNLLADTRDATHKVIRRVCFSSSPVVNLVNRLPLKVLKYLRVLERKERNCGSWKIVCSRTVETYRRPSASLPSKELGEIDVRLLFSSRLEAGVQCTDEEKLVRSTAHSCAATHNCPNMVKVLKRASGNVVS